MYKDIVRFLKINPYLGHYLMLLILDSLKGAVGIIFDSLLIKTIGDGVLENNHSKIMIGVVLYIASNIVMLSALMILTLSLEKMKGKLTAFLRGEFISNSFFGDSESKGNVDHTYYVLTNDTTIITDFFEGFHRAVGSLSRFIAALAVGIFISWYLCVFILVLSIIKILVNKFIVSKMEQTIEGIVAINTKILSNILEVFESSSLYRFLNNKYPFLVLSRLYEKYKPMYKKETLYSVRLTTFNIFLDMICIVLLLAVGSLLSFFGFVSLSAIAAFLSIQDTMTYPITFIGDFLKDFKYQMVSFNRYTNETNKTKKYHDTESFGGIINQIRITDLKFTYSNSNVPILRNVNAEITPGHITYVVGESGVGKTTFFKLLAGLMKPDRGKIEFINDGEIVENPAITYTAQSPLFIKGSIAENIALSNEIDFHKIDVAIQKSQLSTVFEDYDTLKDILIDAKASNLSSGQKTRLTLARAFYHEVYINIFDEIFSSLDNTLISNILPLLNEMSREGKIVMLISHRQDWIPSDAAQIVL